MEIKSFLHFVDKDTISKCGEPGYDRLARILHLVDYKSVYHPHTVDEAMIKFKGRSKIKQYLPKKPIKRGIKVWILADSKNVTCHAKTRLMRF